MPKPVEVAQDMPSRLIAARQAVEDARGALELRLRSRRDLILEAIDIEGMAQREVARLAGIAQSRISAILATPDVEE